MNNNNNNNIHICIAPYGRNFRGANAQISLTLSSRGNRRDCFIMFLFHVSDHNVTKNIKHEQVFIVIKLASPTCHPSRLRMDSSDFAPI